VAKKWMSVMLAGIFAFMLLPQASLISYADVTQPNVFGFGKNSYGQLGLGDNQDRNNLEMLAGLSGARAVANSFKHGLALMENGDVYSFGNGGSGALGHGDTAAQPTPKKIAAIAGAKAIAANGNETDNTAQSFVLTAEGAVYSFGNSPYGLSGQGDLSTRNVPTQIETFMDGATTLTGSSLPAVKAVAAGSSHTLLLTESGDVYAMGRNTSGNLGMGNTNDLFVPTKIPDLPPAVSIAAGNNDSFVITEAGEVYAFGANSYGQLGLGDTNGHVVPTKIETFKLGNGSALTGSALPKVTAVSAGNRHTLLLTDEGDVFAVGEGLGGKLGLGSSSNQSIPVRIESYLNGSTQLKDATLPIITRIAAGMLNQSFVVDEFGTAYIFGGSLSSVPVSFSDLDVQSLATNLDTTLFIAQLSLSRNNRLGSLQVDGQTVTGFSARKQSYIVELPDNATGVPVVTGTPALLTASVSVTPAQEVPGSTTVTVTAGDGTSTRTYTIQFALPSAPTPANPANNTVTVDQPSIELGGTVEITAAGDRQSEPGVTIGDEFYGPVDWTSSETGQSQSYLPSKSTYRANYTPAATGNHTITATFQKYSFDGLEWQPVVGAPDTKTVTVNVYVKVNAAVPAIDLQPTDTFARMGLPATVTVGATVSDGGTLSYQWYRSATGVNSGGTAINGATAAGFTPPTDAIGTLYYYAVVTNTNASATGTKTATATSNVITVTVERMQGDANGDGVVTPADALLVTKYAKSLITLTDDQLAALDLDGDNDVDADDAKIILDIYVKLGARG